LENEKRPSVRVSLFRSIVDDPGRRALAALSALAFFLMIMVVVVNLFAPHTYAEPFSVFYGMQEGYSRVLIPMGFLMLMQSLLLLALSSTYGDYTKASMGKKSVHVRSFLKRLSFYLVLMGAALLLSGGIPKSFGNVL
jgi:hypothetical protein